MNYIIVGFEKQLDIYRYIININNNLSNILINDIIKQIIIDNIDSCISFCRLNNIFIDFNSYFIETNINEIINTHFYYKFLNIFILFEYYNIFLTNIIY